MTKQEFLNKLSHEELLILKDIMSCEIIREINKRNTKTSIEVKVGDCFIYINDYDHIYLTKVISYTSEDHHFDGQYFNCEEISVDSNDIDIYKITYYLEDFEEHDRIDSEIFDEIADSINSRDDAIDKICEGVNRQIRELCSTLLNTQNKN